jgi:hypothetical protein
MKIIRWIALLVGACLLWGQEKPVSSDEVNTVHFEPMNYPLAARLSHTEGVVVMRLRLDDEGNAVSTEALYGAKNLVAECASNAKTWRFKPNKEHLVVIVYDFRIEGLCRLPCPSQFKFRPPNEAVVTIGEAVVDHR